MSFTAKDVQALRQSSGAGMMDCKKALEENGGDIEAAKQWLREKGLAASAKREVRLVLGGGTVWAEDNAPVKVQINIEPDPVPQPAPDLEDADLEDPALGAAAQEEAA